MGLPDIPISMNRDNLDGIPQFDLPPGYGHRWYVPGDASVWRDIQSRADLYNDIPPELFASQFGADDKLLQQRQGFLLDADQTPIATATAWFDDYKAQPYGRLHWVAVVPEMQGRGLAKPLMTIVCNRLRELGHERAYLNTSTARLPAINLYLKFGFVPEVSNPDDVRLWQEVYDRLGRLSR